MESKEHTLTRQIRSEVIDYRAGWGSLHRFMSLVLEWFQAHGEEAKDRHARLEASMADFEKLKNGYATLYECMVKQSCRIAALETEIKKCIQYSPASQRMTDA